MDRPNRLYSEWELWTQETQSPWIFLCEALEMTHVSIFCLTVSGLDADSLNWLLKCKYSLIKQLKSVKSAVSLSLKRRFLLLHMRFLEPAWCRSELETEVCTLDQVPEPQRPLPFPVLLTSFMHESQQHPERERNRSPSFYCLLFQLLLISWRDNHFPQVLKQRLVLPIFVPHWLFQQGHPQRLSLLGVLQALFGSQGTAHICRPILGSSLSVSLRGLACSSHSTQCSGDPVASLPSLCSPAAPLSLPSSRHIRCLSNNYLYFSTWVRESKWRGREKPIRGKAAEWRPALCSTDDLRGRGTACVVRHQQCPLEWACGFVFII